MRKDWKDVALGDILQIDRGGSPRPIKEYLTEDKDGINWIKIGDTKGVKKYITSTFQKIKPSGLNKTRMVYVDDFVLSNSMSFGKPFILKINGAIHDGWLVLRNIFQIVEKNFLFYSLSSPSVYNQFSKKATGSTVKNLNKDLVSSVEINLPPLPEQRAIVSKIEELFSSLENGVANLEKAQAQLKVYRQAVLKKAFEGELTKEWREKQTDLPSAEELLEQINVERERYYEQQLEDWEIKVKKWEESGKEGKKPVKSRRIKDVGSIEEEDQTLLAKLPNSFVWVKLGNVLWSVKDGPHYTPKYSDTGIPFISGGNIRAHGIDFDKVKYISSELHKELSNRCKPELNDILYTKGGTTGIARVNTYDIEFNVWVHVAVLKKVDSIAPFYLQHVLNSNHCYSQAQKYTHGVGNQDLGLTRMVHITLPICSLAEQQLIVQEIESRLSVCDKVEESITTGLQKAMALKQSILKKAFDGKLLSEKELEACRQEVDWEPAEVLLERIKRDKKV